MKDAQVDDAAAEGGEECEEEEGEHEEDPELEGSEDGD